MPLHNGERFLDEAIDSILAQTWQDFEFIIVDDGSTDRTPAILESAADRDPRIVVQRHANRGIVAALNDGLAASRGVYVARMDADDVARADRLAVQVDYLERHPACGLVGSRVVVIDDAGRRLRVMGEAMDHAGLVDAMLANAGQVIYHPVVMFRRALVDGIGGYRHEYPFLEDLDLFLRVAEVAEVTNLEAPLLRYREHFRKVGHTRAREQQRDLLTLLNEFRERLGRPTVVAGSGPTPRPTSRADQHRIWAWWALGDGNVATARHHAIASLVRRPVSPENWRLLLCTLRGH
ncbi:MAG: glycosyltransferase family 2 protein [Planctomycetota bacterium]